MATETLYTIAELADLAGVTPRTIRYYTAEGLLSSPDLRGRYALYGEDHLRRLQLITRLKDSYLPLSEIKARLYQLTFEEVRQLLREYNQPSDQVAVPSAADYIAKVLSSQNIAPALIAPELAPAVSPSVTLLTPAVAPSADLVIPAAPAVADIPVPAAGPRQSQAIVLPSVTAQPEPGETWHRMILGPGAELHMREPATPEARARLDLLIGYARDLFKDT
jgi:DNA-binding transcriptional MerR regulator